MPENRRRGGTKVPGPCVTTPGYHTGKVDPCKVGVTYPWGCSPWLPTEFGRGGRTSAEGGTHSPTTPPGTPTLLPVPTIGGWASGKGSGMAKAGHNTGTGGGLSVHTMFWRGVLGSGLASQEGPRPSGWLLGSSGPVLPLFWPLGPHCCWLLPSQGLPPRRWPSGPGRLRLGFGLGCGWRS